jgi:hypothetical protein
MCLYIQSVAGCSFLLRCIWPPMVEMLPGNTEDVTDMCAWEMARLSHLSVVTISPLWGCWFVVLRFPKDKKGSAIWPAVSQAGIHLRTRMQEALLQQGSEEVLLYEHSCIIAVGPVKWIITPVDSFALSSCTFAWAIKLNTTEWNQQ